MSQQNRKPVPIYDYVNYKGMPVSINNIPSNVPWIWSDAVGGGPAIGPVCWGDKCPDGTTAHGAMYTNIKESPMLVAHYAGEIPNTNIKSIMEFRRN